MKDAEECEEKKESFFKILENKKWLEVIFFVVNMSVILGVYFPVSTKIKNEVLMEKAISRNVDIEYSIISSVSDVSVGNEVISISGWVIKTDAQIVDTKVILQAVDGDDAWVLNAKLSDNSEMKKYAEYLEIAETSKGTGFTTSVNEKQLQQDVSYEVLLYLTYATEVEKQNDDGESETETVGTVKKVSTAQYIYNGEIYRYNPKVFAAPVFMDEQMKTVVEEGILCGYNMENGAWVYLHEGSLYWVLDTSVERNRDENLYMFLHLYSFKSGNLSGNHRQYEFENKDFYFKEREVLLDDNGGYRIAIMNLPLDYLVMYIRTGHYDILANRNYWTICFQFPLQRFS